MTTRERARGVPGGCPSRACLQSGRAPGSDRPGESVRMRRRGQRRPLHHPGACLRHGGLGARRGQHRRDDLRARLGRQAVHGRGHHPPRPGRRDLTGRRRPEVHSRASGLRPDHHDPTPPPPYLRPQGLGVGGRYRGMAPDHPRTHAHPRAGHRQPADVPQLPPGRVLLVHEHRLQPAGGSGGAGERYVLRRVLEEEDLRALGDGEDPVAGRLHEDRRGSGHRVPLRPRRRVVHADALRERPRQRRAPDHRG